MVAAPCAFRANFMVYACIKQNAFLWFCCLTGIDVGHNADVVLLNHETCLGIVSSLK